MNNKLFSIEGHVVVITGGTGVLGSCIARYLASEGARVVVLGRRADEGNAIVADIKSNGGEAMFLTTDVLDAAALEQNCKDVLAAYGRIDALLNAAGGNMPGAIGVPEEQLRQAARLSVCKINIDSDLRLAMTGTIREFFAEHPEKFDPREYLKPARANIKELVRHKLVDVLGCNGKA